MIDGNVDVSIFREPDCKNCESDNYSQDCCHNCLYSDGIFCDELEQYIAKGRGECNRYERREREAGE